MASLVRRSTEDIDWLRGNVAAWKKTPTNIIPYLLGAQYSLNSMQQLEIALKRLDNDGTSMPIEWFLFLMDIYADGHEKALLFSESAARVPETQVVKLIRDQRVRWGE